MLYPWAVTSVFAPVFCAASSSRCWNKKGPCISSPDQFFSSHKLCLLCLHGVVRVNTLVLHLGPDILVDEKLLTWQIHTCLNGQWILAVPLRAGKLAVLYFQGHFQCYQWAPNRWDFFDLQVPSLLSAFLSVNLQSVWYSLCKAHKQRYESTNMVMFIQTVLCHNPAKDHAYP